MYALVDPGIPGQNHPCINRIQLQLHTSTENILV